MAVFLFTSLTGAPFVPTLKNDLDETFSKLYTLKASDLLIDLGSGSGTILEAAIRKKAFAIGIELNPILCLITKWRFRKEPKVKCICRNFYNYSFPKNTTVVYAFAVSLHINAIYRKIQSEANRLDKTLYFISNAFDTSIAKPKAKQSTFYLYEIKPNKS